MPETESSRIWNDACAYYERNIASAPDYLSPAEYAAGKTMEPTDYTDLGEARVFVDQYGGIIRYSSATKWLVYDGMKWNESDLKAQGLAQKLTDRQLDEAREILLEAQAEEEDNENGDSEKAKMARAKINRAKQYRTFVLGRRKSSRIAATLTEARPDVEIDVKELDSDPFLLNTPDGTVDLRTGEIRPHDPADFCTKITAVAPSDKGMDIWLAFLDRITCGDKSLQAYHQICSGMELVGKVFCENLIIAHGSGGNGKSTFYNAKFLVMGDYAGSLSAETLTVNCRKNKSPEYAELRGKRFVIAAELEEGMRLDTAIVKKLCSTDPIRAEKKFKDPFDFMPSHTTILYTNHLPKVGTNDKGTWDRLVVVPFLAKLRGEKGEVKNYADYLFHECGGAILSWMIEGARRFIDAHYIIEQPKIVKDAIESYRQENDWLNNFIVECCEVDESYTEKAGDLFNGYRTYCANMNEYLRQISDFKSAMVAAGYLWKRDKTGAHYFGLRLKSEFAPIV
jgi:P4 family phage/plasmid primase-like protien